MKVETMGDEFDLYFARAALMDDTTESRRGSCPDTTFPVIKEPTDSSHHRRALSCRLPSKRRGSTSPRNKSEHSSPHREVIPESDDQKAESDNGLVAGDSYIYEATLRAPSPCDGKSHSAPHSRSSSWKKSKRPKSAYEPGSERERTRSVPTEESLAQKLERLKILQSDDTCPVRNFSTSSKGIINRGDSYKRLSISSNVSNASSTDAGSCGSASGLIENCEDMDRSRAHSLNSQGTDNESVAVPSHKVVVVGDHGVGKTAILQQFMTSEYLGAIDGSFDDNGDKTISVLLDGEETTMEFVEVDLERNFSAFTDADAYVFVFSVVDRNSFDHAAEILDKIRQDKETHAATIMVANKTEIVRTRNVTEEEAKEMCMKYDCKYIEVSASINHKLDDLLVGIVKQIRLRPARIKRKQQAESTLEDFTCSKYARGIIHKLINGQLYASKSCDNLLAL